MMEPVITYCSTISLGDQRQCCKNLQDVQDRTHRIVFGNKSKINWTPILHASACRGTKLAWLMFLKAFVFLRKYSTRKIPAVTDWILLFQGLEQRQEEKHSHIKELCCSTNFHVNLKEVHSLLLFKSNNKTSSIRKVKFWTVSRSSRRYSLQVEDTAITICGHSWNAHNSSNISTSIATAINLLYFFTLWCCIACNIISYTNQLPIKLKSGCCTNVGGGAKMPNECGMHVGSWGPLHTMLNYLLSL